MNYNFITTKDIKEFLSKNGYIWSGFANKHFASSNPFNRAFYTKTTNFDSISGLVSLDITKPKGKIIVEITPTDFKIKKANPGFPADPFLSTHKDLSQAWQSFLLQCHKKDYSEILKKDYEERKNTLMKLQKNINEDEKSLITEYIKKANSIQKTDTDLTNRIKHLEEKSALL